METTDVLGAKIAFAATTITDFAILLVVAMYVVFSFLLMRQVRLMNRSYSTPLRGMFNFFGRLHLFAALILLLAAIVNL